MMYELNNTRQIDGEHFRRWFSDEVFDLIVWYNDRPHISGFQLCYRLGNIERALTWYKDRGFFHTIVDDGDSWDSGFKMTPILVAGGTFDKNKILPLFQKSAAEIDQEVARFVYSSIKKYPFRSYSSTRID